MGRVLALLFFMLPLLSSLWFWGGALLFASAIPTWPGWLVAGSDSSAFSSVAQAQGPPQPLGLWLWLWLELPCLLIFVENRKVRATERPAATDLGHYPGYSWGTVGVRVGYGWGTVGVQPHTADFPEWGTGGVQLGYAGKFSANRL